MKTETVELCTYSYENTTVQANAKIVDVKYTKRCDTEYTSVCQDVKPKHKYDKTKKICHEIPEETCQNKPMVR